MANLPSTQHALVQKSYGEPLVVEEVPVPQPGPGSALLRVEASPIISYQKYVYNGTRKYPYSTPLVTGTSAVGRIVATGPDATVLKPGQLVLYDMYIHARDDPGTAMFAGMYAGSNGAKTLMEGEWHSGSFAQFVKAPLENCHVLDETRLCRELGYTIGQLTWIARAAVAYGGFRSIGLQAGETVIISPATGAYGGSGAIVAAAMGARVIALGRNSTALKNLAALSPRIHVVQMSDHETEMKALSALGPADAFLDLSPPAAAGSPRLTSPILSLRHGGRVSLMGGLGGEVGLPLTFIVTQDITLKGKLMYDSSDLRDFIKMVETGVLSLDHVKIAGTFPLEQWEEAFDVAEKTRFDDVALLSAW